MPSDETRRMLRVFGVAVTTYEDSVEKGESHDALAKAEGEVRARLQEIAALVERLSAKRK